jgi:predicted Rossmann fold nucleotide-binding protein DprA/Smf involved in DNA uptake
MTALRPTALQPSDAEWPPCLTERLGQAAPPALYAIGPLALLAAHRTAISCSVRTPGASILRAHDAARRMPAARDVAPCTRRNCFLAEFS